MLWWTLRKLRNFATRSDTLQQLVRKRSLEPLLIAVEDQDEYLRQDAAKALGKIGDARAVPFLIRRCLEDSNFNGREAAAEALANIGDARAVPPLVEMLRAPQKCEQTRWAAVHALTKLADTRAVPPLASAMDDTDANVRNAALHVLAALADARAVRAVIAALRDTDNNVRWNAAAAMGKIHDPAALDPLVTLLAREQHIGIRETIIESLGKLGDPRAVPALEKSLEDEVASVRQAAKTALASFGWKPATGKQQLLQAIAEHRWEDLKKQGEAAIEPLLPRLQDRDKEVRVAALSLLNDLGWSPTNDVQRAMHAIAQGHFKEAGQLGIVALHPLMAAYHWYELEAVKGAMEAMETLLYQRASDITEEDLDTLAGLGDQSIVQTRRVYTSSEDDEGHEDFVTVTFSAVLIRQAAQQELKRRKKKR